MVIVNQWPTWYGSGLRHKYRYLDFQEGLVVRHQIRTLQVPMIGAGAFVPVPAVASSTAQFNGQNRVTGAPGTIPVPSPRPPALNDGELGGPYNQPSSVSPNWFLPSIYVAHVNETMLFPGALFANESPKPSTAIGAVVKPNWSKPVIGGNRVTRSVRPFTRWLPYNNGASN